MSAGTREARREECHFHIRDFHPLWSNFPDRSVSNTLVDSRAGRQSRTPASHYSADATVAALHANGLGCFPFARRYWGSRGFFLFLQVLRCFSSLRSPSHPMHSGATSEVLPRSVSAFGDPRVSLLAANRGLSQPCHALHRLSTPEHSPCTLQSLTTLFLRFNIAPKLVLRRLE